MNPSVAPSPPPHPPPPNLHQCLQPKRQRLPWKWSLATSPVSFSGPSESGSLSPAFIKLSVGHPQTVWEGNAKPPKCSSKINLMGGFLSNHDVFRANVLVCAEGFTFNGPQLSGRWSFPTLLRFCHKPGSILGTLLQLGEVEPEIPPPPPTPHGGDGCEKGGRLRFCHVHNVSLCQWGLLLSAERDGQRSPLAL